MATLPRQPQANSREEKMSSDSKYNTELAAAKILLEDIKETLEAEEKENIEHGYERINELIRKLESSKDQTTELMLSEEKTIEEVQEWNRKQKEEIKEFRDLRKKLKQELEKFVEKEKEQKRAVELEHQQNIRTQQERIDREREQTIEEARIRDQQREEEWYRKKLEMELEITKKKTEEIQVKQQSVKLQKYTITPIQRRIQGLAAFLEPVHSRSRRFVFTRYQQVQLTPGTGVWQTKGRHFGTTPLERWLHRGKTDPRENIRKGHQDPQGPNQGVGGTGHNFERSQGERNS